MYCVCCCRAQLPHSCDLCGRRFKNLPALNGHMRLHGGYYKKVEKLFHASVVSLCNVVYILCIWKVIWSVQIAAKNFAGS